VQQTIAQDKTSNLGTSLSETTHLYFESWAWH